MAPDLNSLPSAMTTSDTASSASSGHPRTLSNGDSPTTSPRSTSLAAAATINAGIQNESSRQPPGSPVRARGLSNAGAGASAAPRALATNLSMNDAAVPAPGELQTPSGATVGATSGNTSGHIGGGTSVGGSESGTVGDRRPSQHGFHGGSPGHGVNRSPGGGDPHHHHRAPSIGELHQELEQEQEAQVNRLLQTIRLQQIQLQQLQGANANAPIAPIGAAIEDTPTSERSFHFSAPLSVPGAGGSAASAGPRTHSPAARTSMSRSRRSSGPGSPALRAHSSSLRQQAEDLALSGAERTPVPAGSRDEAAYYQAEAQSLTRENQMLRQRIRELERQIHERTSTPPNANAPTTSSGLANTPMDAEERRPRPA